MVSLTLIHWIVIYPLDSVIQVSLPFPITYYILLEFKIFVVSFLDLIRVYIIDSVNSSSNGRDLSGDFNDLEAAL